MIKGAPKRHLTIVRYADRPWVAIGEHGLRREVTELERRRIEARDEHVRAQVFGDVVDAWRERGAAADLDRLGRS